MTRRRRAAGWVLLWLCNFLLLWAFAWLLSSAGVTFGPRLAADIAAGILLGAAEGWLSARRGARR